MSAKIQLETGDVIEVGKAFVSGKDRIKINDEVVFEGKLPEDYPMDYKLRERRCQIVYKKVSTMLETRTIHVTVFDGDAVIFEGMYDQNGQAVGSGGEAKANSITQGCAIVGMALGVGGMMALNMSTEGAVPGGAVGGAIGGGLGGAIGYGFGKLITSGQ